jgi:hypothetical protein
MMSLSILLVSLLHMWYRNKISIMSKIHIDQVKSLKIYMIQLLDIASIYQNNKIDPIQHFPHLHYDVASVLFHTVVMVVVAIFV